MVKEFLDNEETDFLFDSNKKDALLNSLIRFQSLDKNLDMNNYKLIAKKNCKNYTLLRHFKIMDLELLRKLNKVLKHLHNCLYFF